ncbi:MAG: Z1 domain-containing protein [Gemmatimonadaceae bacterium]
MTPEQRKALLTARALIDVGHSLADILVSSFIPVEHRHFVREELERDENIMLRPARVISAPGQRVDWLRHLDRSKWDYWTNLRSYLLSTKGWGITTVRSIDDSSDRVLRELRAPWESAFDSRGLVLGYVQSGKTANYTAVCAKAADAGYRLIVVLSGIDNGLRSQTNIRLKKELVGLPEGRGSAVRLPPVGQQWHEFTRPGLDGDFNAGLVNHAALQGSQPVLMVIKKNGPVLRRLLRWLEDAPGEVLRTVPLLVIDDEADLASVDTRGSYQTEDESPDPDYEPPSVINGLIRQLLTMFSRRAYVAYTATPFANILIPHDTSSPDVGNDLYPKDFIVDLPKPAGYFGAEEIFGRVDPDTGTQSGGLDCIRSVVDADIVTLEMGVLPGSLNDALQDFILATAARHARDGIDSPSTMLVHTSHRIAAQAQLFGLLNAAVRELRDEWRYQRDSGLRDKFASRWDSEFRTVTCVSHPDRDTDFSSIEAHIGPTLEALQVREVNSARGEVLDYEREPQLKAVAIGGNKLSRGLTLEGLLVSYYVRRSATYDTVMQMGRWFGFRSGHEDLTRLYTTPELAGWFADLARVEIHLREELAIYEDESLTPLQVGVRIWQHPDMEVTNRLKRRFATTTVATQSYSEQLAQTFHFPLSRIDELALQAEIGVAAFRHMVSELSPVDFSLSGPRGPVWTNVPPENVLRFLDEYAVDERARSFSKDALHRYIVSCVDAGELTRWTIAVCGLSSPDPALRTADWGLPTGSVNFVSRSRKLIPDDIGALVDPKDEGIGLPVVGLRGRAARRQRDPQEGLLLLYPISRYSGYDLKPPYRFRMPLFENPEHPLARDMLGVAFSFPTSRRMFPGEAYVRGTAPDRSEATDSRSANS